MRGREPSLRDFPAYTRPPADKIGKYKILGTLGRGGMGIVYKGLDPDIEREVAIKTIRFEAFTESAEKEEMLARVVREAKAAGRLNHPNIITVYDVIRHKDLTFIVMQYVDGQSLQARIESGVRPSPQEVVDLLGPVADALDFAHKNGIIHRDVKPANVLIDKQGRPFLADFGVAHMEASTMTGPGKTIGTISYMSPEQVMGTAVDHRADLFALGVILYELLTGQKPFAGDNLSTIVYKIVNEEPPRVTEINHDLPRGYEEVIKKALAKNPDERYQSGREMVSDLKASRTFAEATRAYESEPSKPEAAARGKKWPLALAGGMGVFAVLAFLGYKILPQKEAAPGAVSPGIKASAPQVAGSGAVRADMPPASAAPAAADALAALRASFDRKSYAEAVALADKMLTEDPNNQAAREYRDKAAEAVKAEQDKRQAAARVASILDAGMADFRRGDYAACAAAMERVLKLDGANAAARDYLYQADTALSKKDILDMLDNHRRAEEAKDLPAILSRMAGTAPKARARSQYKEWFNGYDEITSRIDEDKTFAFADRSTATLGFSQRIYGVDRTDRKKKMLFEGRRIWDLKKAEGGWTIVQVR